MRISGTQQIRLQGAAVAVLMVIFLPFLIGHLIFRFAFVPVADWTLGRIALMGPLSEQEKRKMERRKEKWRSTPWWDRY